MDKKSEDLYQKIKAHMETAEGIQAEIRLLESENREIERKRRIRRKSRAHLHILQQPLDASAHVHETQILARNQKYIAKLKAKLAAITKSEE